MFSVILYNIIFHAKCQVAFLILLHCCEHGSGSLWLIQGYSCYKFWRLFKTRMGVRVDLCQHFCWELAQFHYAWGSPQFFAFACLGYIDPAERFCRACKVEKPHDRNSITYSFIMTYMRETKKRSDFSTIQCSCEASMKNCFCSMRLAECRQIEEGLSNWAGAPRALYVLFNSFLINWVTKGQINCLACAFIHQMKKLRPKVVKWLFQTEGELGAKPECVGPRSSDS